MPFTADEARKAVKLVVEIDLRKCEPEIYHPSQIGDIIILWQEEDEKGSMKIDMISPMFKIIYWKREGERAAKLRVASEPRICRMCGKWIEKGEEYWFRGGENYHLKCWPVLPKKMRKSLNKR